MEADPPREHDLIRRMYRAHNTCDLQRLASFMSEEADQYSSRLWAGVHVHDDVVGIAHAGPERTAVRVSQVVRNLGVEVVSTGDFEHT